MNTPFPDALPAGTFLDSGDNKYRIEKVLGQGGFGITYLTVGEIRYGHVTTEATFAVKEHFPDTSCIRQGLQVVPKEGTEKEYEITKSDFISEAGKLHSLGIECDNIVKVNEVFEANGTAYYVMQYIKGESLTDYIESHGPLKFDDAVAILEPIIDAVGFLHDSMLNHFDIKPDNIMLDHKIDKTVPVLIDFGLCAHYNKNGKCTKTLRVLGVTPGYSPFEQYAGIDEFSPQADIYALAATLLYMLTGKTPEESRRLDPVRVSCDLQKAGLTPSQVDALKHALSKYSEERTSSIPEFKAELGLTAPSGGTVKIVREPQPMWKRLALPAAIVIIIALLGVILWQTFCAERSPKQEDIDTTKFVKVKVSSADSVAAYLSPEDRPEPEPTVTKEQTPEPTVQKNVASTTKTEPTPKEPTPKADTKPTQGTLSMGYATYKGGVKNGRPHGNGRLSFHSTHAVDSHSSVTANPGDYLVATYENGSLIMGRLYDSEGNLLKTIVP